MIPSMHITFIGIDGLEMKSPYIIREVKQLKKVGCYPTNIRKKFLPLFYQSSLENCGPIPVLKYQIGDRLTKPRVAGHGQTCHEEVKALYFLRE